MVEIMDDIIWNKFEIVKILLTALGSGVVAYFVSIWNFNSKRKEIKLTGYYKDRIEAVKILYSLLVTLHFSSRALFETNYAKLDHHTYKNLLVKWLSDYGPLYEYYSKNRILLVDDSKYKTRSQDVRNNLNHISTLRAAIHIEYRKLEEREKNFEGQLHTEYYGGFEEEEVSMIVTERAEFSSKSENAWIIKSFGVFRESLEDYFKHLVK